HERIPLSGRITAVADVFDALTHERPYKQAWTVKDALTEIEACAGSHFDPAVVEALLRIGPELCVLESDAATVAAPPPRHLAMAAAPAPPDPATLATLRMLQEERDELAQEVMELRQQLTQQEPKVVRVRRWTQPN